MARYAAAAARAMVAADEAASEAASSGGGLICEVQLQLLAVARKRHPATQWHPPSLHRCCRDGMGTRFWFAGSDAGIAGERDTQAAQRSVCSDV